MNTQIANNEVENAQTKAPKVWLITGASRGIGATLASAVLATGDKVVATGRNAEAVEKALGGPAENLLTLQLDVTNAQQAKEVVAQIVAHFGSLDILVNNAGYALLGALEEVTAEEVQAQFDTNVFGLISVTQATLPVMRNQKSGHIINLSSIGGFKGFGHGSMYSATKFAVEGISESLALEVAEFGIRVMIVEPGYFRTEFLANNSVNYAANRLAAYDNGSLEQVAHQNGQQAGDPVKLAQALLTVLASENPPLRLSLGVDAVEWIESKLESVKAELDEWRELSLSTNIDE